MPVVAPIQVLQDPAGVAHHLVVVDQDGHVRKPGELEDLRAIPPPAADPLGAVLEALALEAPGDRPAGAEEVGWGAAAVEDSFGLGHGLEGKHAERLAGRTQGEIGEPVTLGALAELIELPAHGVLERLLMGPRLPPELLARLVVAVGEPLGP
jgi:hypothetical protein